MDDRVTHLARANWRNRNRLFGIRAMDRRQHMYIVGQTGTGKTTLLECLMRQDISGGEGLAVLDPHGDLAARIGRYAIGKRRADTILFNPADPACPYRFNPIGGISEDRRTVAVGSLIEAFQKFWTSSWGPRLEHILRNAFLLLVEETGATLADIPRLFHDQAFRRLLTDRCTNHQVRRFWLEEFPGYRSDALGPILNKVGAFLADPIVYRTVVSTGTNLDVRRIMDEGKILIANLAKGRIGGPNAALLGALLLSRIELAALERVETREEDRREFWVYLDEFQNVMTLGLASMLSELRKYRVGLVLAHQFVAQLTDEVRTAILGNVGTIISFRLGLNDAKHLEGLFSPVFERDDLTALPNHYIYIRLMVDGKVTTPFSAVTMPPG